MKKGGIEAQLIGSEVPSLSSSLKGIRPEVWRTMEVPLRLRENDGRGDREPYSRKTQKLRVRSGRPDGVQSKGEDDNKRLRLRRRLETPEGKSAHGESARAHPSDGEKTGPPSVQRRRSTPQERTKGRQQAGKLGAMVSQSSGGIASVGSVEVGAADIASIPYDAINPRHYRLHPAGIECIDIVEHMSFNVGAAVKYLWRAGLKNPNVVEDLRKAAWFINREIQRLEKK